MGLNLKKIAKKATTLPSLMKNREKIDTEDIKKFYPKGISINAIDVLHDSEHDKDFYVFTIIEDIRVFAFSGEVLNRVFNEWVKAADGEISAVNEALAKEPVKVILGTEKNKQKQEYTTVTVVD